METVAREGELVLRRREDGSLELRANGVFVMDTVETSTEQALATRALELHPLPRRVLVGGLGLGFTLEAVLADARVERCTVVEIESALVGWMRDGTIAYGPALLADARARVQVGDVAVALRESAPAAYDVVLLDVDNGPSYLVHDANADLYRAPLLWEAARVLAPEGRLVIWSASSEPALVEAMGTVFAEVEELSFAVDLQGRDEQYWLFSGTSATS